MDVEIRVAKADDWEIIQRLNNQVFLSDKENDEDLDLNRPFSEEGIKYYKDLASGKYGKCFLAYLDDIPVGYIALAIKNFGYRKGKHVEVENIGIEPEYWSRGIGKLLMEMAVKWAKKQNASKLYVCAYSRNTRAINFYKKNGFSEIGLELEKKV